MLRVNTTLIVKEVVNLVTGALIVRMVWILLDGAVFARRVPCQDYFFVPVIARLLDIAPV